MENNLIIVENDMIDNINNMKTPETFKFSLIRNKGIWYIKEENSNLDICKWGK